MFFPKERDRIFFTGEKCRVRVAELAPWRYREPRSIETWSFLLDADGEVGMRPPSMEQASTLQVGESWSGQDRYAWLAAEVEVPGEWEGKQVVGLFNFGQPGSDGPIGFEALLYLNGEPFQGVDVNHQEVFLPASAAGKRFSFHLRLWSGLMESGASHPRNHRFNQAALTWLDEPTDDLYFTATAMVETALVLREEDPDSSALLDAVNTALNLLERSHPGSESFYASVIKARDSLRAFLQAHPKHHQVTVHALGHSHIDVAWLWRLKHTREKAARTFSTVLRLMERYPEYVFVQTQPQLYDYIRQDYPDIYQRVKAQVNEGRWEAEGVMWLEPDCNLPSGESLVRQILFGSRFLEQEFGRTCTCLLLPDAFGYSWALPQILRKSGIEAFITSKMDWNQYNKMPHDTFMWRGIDGSEVLAYFITTPYLKNDPRFSYTYNGEVRAETVQGVWSAYREKQLSLDVLLLYGYGDGGGGPNREMLELRRRLNEIPGIPRVVTGRADEYCRALLKQVQEAETYVHTWDGELYLEMHRGVLTSQAYSKRMNRKLELGYRETEWINSLAATLNGSMSVYPQEVLNGGWQIILRNQFHDVLPGSSIHEVYEDCIVEYGEASQRMEQAWDNGVKVLLRSEPQSYVIWNSAAWERTAVVEIAGIDEEEGVFYDGKGHVLKAQRTGSNWWVEIPLVPSLGYTTITFQPSRKQKEQVSDANPFAFNGNTLKTPYYEIEWNEQGQLTRLFDRQAGREVLARGQAGNVLQVFEDRPLIPRHDAWDIDVFYQEKMRPVSELIECHLSEAGPLWAEVRFVWSYEKSRIIQDMRVYTNNRRIDFATRIDWHEQHQLLKVAFPVEVRATEATYDIQFGSIKRPTHWNTSWDLARFEVVGHQWADLSERGYGVALANDCKYGYDVKDNVLRLSLIKSATYPDPLADQGEHVFTYALIPHQGDWLEGGVSELAWDLNSPLRVSEGKPANPTFSLFHFSSSGVQVDAVKKAEDSDQIVLRLHDFSGGRRSVSIESERQIVRWQECDLLERPSGEVQTSPFTFELKPYEIKTFLLYLISP
jgi:alpha-mannosidase